jgi:hypothetical protein
MSEFCPKDHGQKRDRPAGGEDNSLPRRFAFPDQKPARGGTTR